MGLDGGAMRMPSTPVEIGSMVAIPASVTQHDRWAVGKARWTGALFRSCPKLYPFGPELSPWHSYHRDNTI
jgi:hypothetical protein